MSHSHGEVEPSILSKDSLRNCRFLKLTVPTQMAGAQDTQVRSKSLGGRASEPWVPLRLPPRPGGLQAGRGPQASTQTDLRGDPARTFPARMQTGLGRGPAHSEKAVQPLRWWQRAL